MRRRGRQSASVLICLLYPLAKGKTTRKPSSLARLHLSAHLGCEFYRLEAAVGDGVVIGLRHIEHKRGNDIAYAFFDTFSDTFSNAFGGASASTSHISLVVVGGCSFELTSLSLSPGQLRK